MSISIGAPPVGRGKGWHRDVNPTAPGFGAFRAQIDPKVPPRDMVREIDKLRDQTVTSCCVGFAFARAINIRARLMGIDAPYPSAQAIYTVARLKGGAPTLVDQGCMPADAADGLQGYGVVDEARWAFDEAKINDVPPWDVFQAGADAKVGGAFRIDAFGQARVDQVKTALAAGYPVAFGMSVDQAYEDWHGGEPYGGPRGTSLGGHMQCLIYDPELSKLAQFRVANSWAGWGEGVSTSRVTEAFVGSSLVSDLYIITLAPQGTH